MTPSEAGLVIELSAREGQRVSKGTSLAAVRIDRDLGKGDAAAVLTGAAIARQDQSLETQAKESAVAVEAQLSQVAARRSGITYEIAGLMAQIRLQREVVDSARKEVEDATEITARGFMSKRDFRTLEVTYLTHQQQLVQLEQSLSTKRSELDQANRSAAEAAAHGRSQAASIEADRAQLAQLATNARSAQSYLIVAPVDGTVTGVVTHVGQTVSSQSILMSMVPAGAILQAELQVPSTSIGFVKTGQEVALALDAFPYQRFGTIKGRVRSVSQVAIPSQVASNNTSLYYLVIVNISKPDIKAYGQIERIAPGMSLTARITTERQTLLRWVFDPLFAILNR
jgi:membrane fusion protein